MIRVQAIWAWIALASFITSITLGNLYYTANAGDRMTAVRIFLACVLLLLTYYSTLLAIRQPKPSWLLLLMGALIASASIIGLSAFGLEISDGWLRNLDVYDLSSKYIIALVKVITALVVLTIWLTFVVTQIFERVTWAILLGLEGYSAVQYPLCKIAPGGSLDPSRYLEWGDPLAKSACSRAFGPVMAYADVVVCGLMMSWALWRWRRAR